MSARLIGEPKIYTHRETRESSKPEDQVEEEDRPQQDTGPVELFVDKQGGYALN